MWGAASGVSQQTHTHTHKDCWRNRLCLSQQFKEKMQKDKKARALEKSIAILEHARKKYVGCHSQLLLPLFIADVSRSTAHHPTPTHTHSPQDNC